MLSVKTPEEVLPLIVNTFPAGPLGTETIPLEEAAGRVLGHPVSAAEYVPGFDRSTVDGYAVYAADTFGCSDAMPALLELSGEVLMGEKADIVLQKGKCVSVPTGGAIPEGADAVVMIEYTEDYGDGTVGILKSAAPGMNLIYRGDDVFPGKEVMSAGRKLTAGDIGALAALGTADVKAAIRPRVGILSTGDELVPVGEVPAEGQVRDVNSAMLGALVKDAGGESVQYGIVPDDETKLLNVLDRALAECDLVLISGGSSVGTKDAAYRVIEKRGEILFHGIAMKPGKPTILGNVSGKPVFGLPGHPVAACFVSELFVRPLIGRMLGRKVNPRHIKAVLSETISANHGRAQYMGVHLKTEDGRLYAVPIHTKSGLITSLAGSDGFICIPRDREGAAAGEMIDARLYSID